MNATGLDVLDRTVPLRWTQGAPIFTALLDEWDDNKTVRRVSQRAGWQDALIEGTYLRALTEQTQPFKAITADIHTEYPELSPERRDADWETEQHTLEALGGDAA